MHDYTLTHHYAKSQPSTYLQLEIRR